MDQLDFENDPEVAFPIAMHLIEIRVFAKKMTLSFEATPLFSHNFHRNPLRHISFGNLLSSSCDVLGSLEIIFSKRDMETFSTHVA